MKMPRLSLNPAIIIVNILRLGIVLLISTMAMAQWEIQEDIPLGSTSVTYKPFRDAWVVSFDISTSTALRYTLAIPQICTSSCHVASLNYMGLNCAEVNNLLLDPAWFNEMAVSDIGEKTQCPRSFANWNEAQYLLGAVNLRSTIYMTMPTALTIHNDFTFLSTFDANGRNSTSWAITFRIIFLTAIEVGNVHRFSVRLYVGTVILTKPLASMATLAVTNACRMLGLLAPPNSHLKMHVGADKQPVCMWDCRIDAMRSPWNLYPKTREEIKSVKDIGVCRPLTKYFTAVEFMFIIDTAMISSNAERLNSLFFDELNMFTAFLEVAMTSTDTVNIAATAANTAPARNTSHNYLTALTIPYSDFDTHNWHSWIRSFIAFSHRNDVMFDTEFMNETILLDTLKRLDIYQVVENDNFIYDPSLLIRRNIPARRFATHSLTVKGLLFTNDVTSQLSFFSDALKQNILQSTFQFSPSLQVNKPILVDIRRMHRVALPTEETTYVTDMHRAGVYTLQVSVILIIVIMLLYKTTRGHRSVWL